MTRALVVHAVGFLLLAGAPWQFQQPVLSDVEKERAANLATYHDYVHSREWMFAKHAGRWIVIVGGKLLPWVDGEGLAPVATLAEIDAIARKAYPAARHRFVFRIGEDGDLAYNLGGTTDSRVVGRGFLALLGATMDGRTLQIKQPPLVIPIHRESQSAPWLIAAHLRAPSVEGKGTPQSLVLSTGFGGIATLPEEDAEALRAELWEIPGRVDVAGILRSGICRRARVTFAFPEQDFAVEIPVAVWPR